MEISLLHWAIVFLILSLVAGTLGFGFISGFSFSIGKLLAVIFVILFVVSIVSHSLQRV